MYSTLQPFLQLLFRINVREALVAVHNHRRLFVDARAPVDVASAVGGWIRLGLSKLFPLAEDTDKLRRAVFTAKKARLRGKAGASC